MDETLALLVVDDDQVDRLAVRRALREAGLPAQLCEASDEAGAIAALLEQHFDCALLDYQLGAGNGLAVLRAVRDAGIRTPIVMLTGQSDMTLIVELLRAGASDYLPKEALSAARLAQSIRQAVRVAQAEQAAARAAAALRFLSEASALFSASLDYSTTLKSLVELVVPAFADWCTVEMVEADGAYHGNSFVQALPHLLPAVQRLRQNYRYDPNVPFGFPHVLRTGEAELNPCVTEATLHAVTQDAHHLALLRELDVTSYLSVPLRAREHLLGVWTMARTGSRERYDAADLELATELSRRAALAVDNARLYQEARDALRMRDAFLSIASHELKTPLTTLQGYAELLRRRAEREQGISSQNLRAIQLISDQARRLNRMVDSLLDFSRLELGQLSIERDQVDVAALLGRLIEELRPTLTAHHFELAGLEQPLVTWGDGLRLEQVFLNLLQNAIKYSPGGGTIRVEAACQPHEFCVAVADEGIGIPQEALPHLFERFYRAATGEVRQISGAGLGLFIVREIVSLHGGRVEASSREGQGSTFSVCLPLANGERV